MGCVVLGDYQMTDNVLGRMVLSFLHDERALQCRSYHNEATNLVSTSYGSYE